MTSEIVYTFVNRAGQPVTGLQPFEVRIGQLISVDEQDGRLVAVFRVEGSVA